SWPMALPYMADAPAKFRSVYLLKKDNTMQSAGGLITTAADLATWAKVHISKGKLNGKRLFSEKVMQDAQKAWAATDERRGPFQGAGYGYGWMVGALGGEQAVWHSGGFPGYLSVMSFMPEHKIGVNVLINEPSVGFRLMYLLAAFSYDWWLKNEDVLGDYKVQIQEMAQQLSKRQEKVAAHRKELAEREWQLTEDFAAFSGRYVNEAYGTIEIDGSKGQLAVKMGNMYCIATPYTKENTARVEMVPGRGEVLVFNVENGNVTELKSDGDIFKKVSQ
nr:beta-lactamase family protein [Saprospiraceae bacterium]